jgi:hypothetical protein
MAAHTIEVGIDAKTLEQRLKTSLGVGSKSPHRYATAPRGFTLTNPGRGSKGDPCCVTTKPTSEGCRVRLVCESARLGVNAATMAIAGPFAGAGFAGLRAVFTGDESFHAVLPIVGGTVLVLELAAIATYVLSSVPQAYIDLIRRAEANELPTTTERTRKRVRPTVTHIDDSTVEIRTELPLPDIATATEKQESFSSLFTGNVHYEIEWGYRNEHLEGEMHTRSDRQRRRGQSGGPTVRVRAEHIDGATVVTLSRYVSARNPGPVVGWLQGERGVPANYVKAVVAGLTAVARDPLDHDTPGATAR